MLGEFGGFERLSEAILLALSQADDAVSRLDERVRACAFREGWIERLNYAEATAWGWTSGNIVSTEDLVLHDHAADVRQPDQNLRAAHGLVRARIRAVGAGPELISAAGVGWLNGARKDPPIANGAPALPFARRDPADIDGPELLVRLAARLCAIEQGVSESADAAMGEWLNLLHDYERGVPLLLHAAMALEGWKIINPLPRRAYVGPILVGHWLRGRRRVQTHLLGIESGVRAHARKRRDVFATAPAARLAYWLRVMAEAADQGMAELHRLELARQVLAQHVQGRRSDSHLQAVIDLMMARPVVTAPMLAETLHVSQTSARRLVAALGPSVKEISGRSRFRAWRA
jgi:hypothetical protein